MAAQTELIKKLTEKLEHVLIKNEKSNEHENTHEDRMDHEDDDDSKPSNSSRIDQIESKLQRMMVVMEIIAGNKCANDYEAPDASRLENNNKRASLNCLFLILFFLLLLLFIQFTSILTLSFFLILGVFFNIISSKQNLFTKHEKKKEWKKERKT